MNKGFDLFMGIFGIIALPYAANRIYELDPNTGLFWGIWSAVVWFGFIGMTATILKEIENGK